MARQADDEFAVIACDGIWDVMSSQEVVDKVREMLQHGRPEMPPLEEPPGPDIDGAGPQDARSTSAPKSAENVSATSKDGVGS